MACPQRNNTPVSKLETPLSDLDSSLGSYPHGFDHKRPDRSNRYHGRHGLKRTLMCWLHIGVVLATTLEVAHAERGASEPSANIQAAVQPASKPGDKAAGRKFGELIGLGVKFSQGQPMRELPTLTELGVRWVREDVGWKYVETSPGQYRFPPDFVERLKFYREHRIRVVYLLAYGNSVAYPATPEAPNRPVDPEAFGRYAVAAARLLREAGVSFVLEVWNEPHNSLRPRFGGAWNGKPPSPWVDHYLKMVAETVRQVKAFDPSIKILDDDDMWIIHYWFLEAGLPRELDGFAVHPYAPRGPEKAAVDRLTDWCRPFEVVDDHSSFQSAVHRLRDQGLNKLGKVPEMWITEWGWAIGENTPRGPVTEDMLAGLLPRAFIMGAAAGVEALLWFSAQDTVDGPMGLTANDGRRRMSYFAFKVMNQQLGDYRLVRQVAGMDHPTSGVQAYLFQGERDYKLVIWNIDADRQALELSGPLRSARATDVLGQPVPVERRTRNTARAVTFGASPIYVTRVPGNDQIDKALAKQLAR